MELPSQSLTAEAENDAFQVWNLQTSRGGKFSGEPCLTSGVISISHQTGEEKSSTQSAGWLRILVQQGKHRCICTVFFETISLTRLVNGLTFQPLPCFSLTLILFAPRRDDMQFTPAHNEEISGSTYQNITKDSQDRIPCNHHGNWKTCLEGGKFHSRPSEVFIPIQAFENLSIIFQDFTCCTTTGGGC